MFRKIMKLVRSTMHTMPEEARVNYRHQPFYAEQEARAHFKSRVVQRDARNWQEDRERVRER